MLRLYLLAHAPTLAQREGRFPADEGIIQPADPAIVARVTPRIGRCDAIWSGPERRCRQTATALGVAAAASDDLAAWPSGAWAGREIGWVAEHDPAGLHAWRTDPDFATAGGESLARFVRRVSGWVRARQQPDGRALVIADQTVIRAIVLHVLDAEVRSFWRLDVAPWSLSVVQYANGEWRLRSLDAAGAATE
jgi:broad specificity phosphatase PhoE